MGRFRINDEIKEKLEKYGQQKSKQLAIETREKLSKHYHSLVDLYYSEKQGVKKNGEPYYFRTYGLYKSYKKYYKNVHNSIYYGGVEITPDKMNDYPSLNGEGFSAKRLLDKFIYTSTLPSSTWHGGDWHGGYGIMSNFSVYNEMNKYYNKLLKEYKSKCSVK